MTKNYSGEFPNQGGLGNLHMQKALYRRQPYSALLHLLPGAQWSILKKSHSEISQFQTSKIKQIWKGFCNYSQSSTLLFIQNYFHITILENDWLQRVRHKIGPLNFRMESSVLDHCVYPGHCNHCGRPCHFWLQPRRCNIELAWFRCFLAFF